MAVAEQSVALFQNMQTEIAALRKQHIACLGDGEVFIKRNQNGTLRSVKGTVTLDETNGDIAVIKGKAMVTGKGFYRANQITSLSIITPDKLTLPTGQVVVNPYPIIDEESGTIRKVWAKKMAVGYGPIGNLVITTATLLYDINMYFIQDLLKKVTGSAGAGRVCMESMLTDKEKQVGMFYKIDGALGIWVDFGHKDILKAIDTFVNKKQFCERNAQTIATRLAMGQHPALSHITYVNAAGKEYHRTAKVTLVGYVHDFTQDQLLDMAGQAEEGKEIVIGDQKAEVIDVKAEASADDINTDVDDEENLNKAASDEPEDAGNNMFSNGNDKFEQDLNALGGDMF